EGLLVLPGIIDAHVHIQLDTGLYRAEDGWLDGSQSAAFGGVTTVVDFATQFTGQTFQQALENRLQEVQPSVIDYAFHMMVTDIEPGQEESLGELVDMGIQSIKLYTTYRPNYYADDATIVRLLDAASRIGLISLMHCENDAIVTAQTQELVQEGNTGWCYHGIARPSLAEQEATARILFLAEKTHAPVVVAHNSTALTSELVARAKNRGIKAYSETAPQYLLLDDTLYESPEPWRYILQPPLRTKAESEGLWNLVAKGQLDMIITDHCGYTADQKLKKNDFTKTPGGLPGLETSLALMATYGIDDRRIEWPDLIRMMVTKPASIYNLWPRKGALLPGSDADIVIYNPSMPWTITQDELHNTTGFTPFEGYPVTGKVISTIRRGEFLVENGIFVGKQATGKFLKRAPVFED
ncbi:MAG: amidohydrolase family protein, partial [Anaerolineae bacterium]|nr:amidohydrolase family protein [Anaerolineae bacterium]